MTRKRPSSRRQLAEDEQELWRAVVETVTPLFVSREKTVARNTSVMPRLNPAKVASFAFQPTLPFEVGAGSKLHAPLPAKPPVKPLQMDAKLHRTLTRGKLAPEARIDLHGMTLAEAQPALNAFISNARTRGLRLVLVITGKGQGGRSEPFEAKGVLRRYVPQWLASVPLKAAVLEVCQAHMRHGGGGAYYVYLRKL